MTLAFVIQTLVSLVAILGLAGLAAWARIARPVAGLDESEARRRLAEEFPDAPLQAVWVAADGASAVARSGGSALLLFRLGDGYAARSAPWEALAAARASGTMREVRLHDITAPRVRLAWPGDAPWPPVGDAA